MFSYAQGHIKMLLTILSVFPVLLTNQTCRQPLGWDLSEIKEQRKFFKR